MMQFTDAFCLVFGYCLSMATSSAKERFDQLKAVTGDFPKNPGVYLMKNEPGKIIYVGKAKNLRSRVKSYFSNSDKTRKTEALVRSIYHIEFIVTKTEAEAFLLEASLIKKHRPRYNVRLKDDKSYPYIRLSQADDYPRFYLARKVRRDGSIYYGPYTSGYTVRSTIEFLNRAYKVRDCSDHFMASQKRPCLTYEIGRCTAPCVGLIDKEGYAKYLKDAKSFFKNKNTRLLKTLEQKMHDFSNDERFELAADMRDSLSAIQKVLEKQSVINANSDTDQDVFNYFGDHRGTLISTLHVRHGRVIGQKGYYYPLLDANAKDEDAREWLLSFLTQYYENNIVPDEILLPIDIGGDLSSLLKDVLSLYTESFTKVTFPTRESGRKLLELGLHNAEKQFLNHVTKSEKKKEALALIQKKLHMKKLPHRIECFDISHFQGEGTVGSQVVFEEGVPNKDQYRRYKVKTVTGVDDYKSMKEVLSRRLQHGEWEEPDLIIIDGGRGQLKVAYEVLKELRKEHIAIVGLAKERTKSEFKEQSITKTKERFYIPNRQNPVTFSESSEAFRILVSLRDEAHRFAVTFHRKLREKAFIPNE